MEQINIKKHTKYSLEFVFSESDKHLTDVLNSISQNSNRSFFLFGLYLSLMTFSFSKIITQEYEYLILLIGSIISSLILRNNLFPTLRDIKGSKPSDMILSYFDDFKNENLEKEYLATQIHSYNDSIELNKNLICKMVKRYSDSFKNLIVFVFIFFVIFLFMFIKSH